MITDLPLHSIRQFKGNCQIPRNIFCDLLTRDKDINVNVKLTLPDDMNNFLLPCKQAECHTSQQKSFPECYVCQNCKVSCIKSCSKNIGTCKILSCSKIHEPKLSRCNNKTNYILSPHQSPKQLYHCFKCTNNGTNSESINYIKKYPKYGNNQLSTFKTDVDTYDELEENKSPSLMMCKENDFVCNCELKSCESIETCCVCESKDCRTSRYHGICNQCMYDHRDKCLKVKCLACKSNGLCNLKESLKCNHSQGAELKCDSIRCKEIISERQNCSSSESLKSSCNNLDEYCRDKKIPLNLKSKPSDIPLESLCKCLKDKNLNPRKCKVEKDVKYCICCNNLSKSADKVGKCKRCLHMKFKNKCMSCLETTSKCTEDKPSNPSISENDKKINCCFCSFNSRTCEVGNCEFCVNVDDNKHINHFKKFSEQCISVMNEIKYLLTEQNTLHCGNQHSAHLLNEERNMLSPSAMPKSECTNYIESLEKWGFRCNNLLGNVIKKLGDTKCQCRYGKE